MTDTRALPLADVLSITTGKLLTRGGGAALDDILNWATGDHLLWWQAPRAADACTEAFIAQHPFLAELVPPDDLDQADLYAWLTAVEAEHGIELTPHLLRGAEAMGRFARSMDRLTTEAGVSTEHAAKLSEALRAMGDQEGERP